MAEEVATLREVRHLASADWSPVLSLAPPGERRLVPGPQPRATWRAPTGVRWVPQAARCAVRGKCAKVFKSVRKRARGCSQSRAEMDGGKHRRRLFAVTCFARANDCNKHDEVHE
eukprot:8818122-Pyramimonas_sp.AAC.1